MKTTSKNIIIGIVIILLIILIWGFIGGNQSEKIGIDCDFGLGDSLCWFWHKNIIGDFQDNVKDLQNSLENAFNE